MRVRGKTRTRGRTKESVSTNISPAFGVLLFSESCTGLSGGGKKDSDKEWGKEKKEQFSKISLGEGPVSI